MRKKIIGLKEVGQYILNQTPEVQQALTDLRHAIWDAAPHVIELMNYKIPAFALLPGGKRDQQIMIAGFSKHVGFYPTPDVIEAFEDRLGEYKFAKGSIQFPLDKPIPRKLIKEMVKFRLSTLQETISPLQKSAKVSKPAVRKPLNPGAAKSNAATILPESMVTGKASSAKAQVGDKPVFSYIASLPQPQRSIAEYIDSLAAKTIPTLQRSVKWGMSYYGSGDGWCFCCGGFAGHVKLMFINGAALVPEPPVTPVAMGKSTRGVELKSMDEINKRQFAKWMRQAVAVPGVGRKKK
jgi:uncharacterized protein YdhG (YjbR/CyaY superfamily)